MSGTLSIRMSRAALVATVDAMLHHIFQYELTDCHNLETLVAECSSAQCAADMEVLRLAHSNGVSVEERLKAVR